MRMLRKAGHDIAVIHTPAVLARKVLADVAALERCGGTEAIVAARILIDVMDADEERVLRLPWERERRDADDRIRAHGTFGSTPRLCIKNVSMSPVASSAFVRLLAP